MGGTGAEDEGRHGYLDLCRHPALFCVWIAGPPLCLGLRSAVLGHDCVSK